MNALFETTAGNEVVNVLADGQRRRVLDVLGDRESPMDVSDLAAHLAAGETGSSEQTDGGAFSADRRRAVTINLRHVHLPALADAGLVSVDTSGETVAPADDVPVDDAALQRVVETDVDGWSDVLDALADDRRRTALAVLAEGDGDLSCASLAEAVATREVTGVPSSELVESVLASLYHVHLPVLRQADLVDFDPAAETVAYRGHPALDDDTSGVELATPSAGSRAAAED